MIEVKIVKDPAGLSSNEHVVVSAFGNPKVWNTSDKAASLPLIEVAKLAYALIIPRVFTRGRTETGQSFKPQFSAKPTRYWVLPHRPQPPGFVEESKRYKGRKRYESAAHYRRLLGMTTPRLVESGRLARSIKIKALTPRRIIIVPTGGRPGERSQNSTNRKLLRNLIRGRYRRSVIIPSRGEEADLVKLLKEIYPAQLIDTAIASELGFLARKKLATRQRAVKRVLNKQKAAQRKAQNQGSR
tara:strand:- start:60 stop:788 length:729 start_codon:yes stop_codon:yes gene_type:complete